MKHKLMISIILVLAVVGLTACGSNVTPAVETSSQTLSINGTGVVYLSPDMATINLGVMTEGSDVKAATAESSAVIEKIKQVLEEYGVDPADVQTTNFSVYPMNDYGIELESTSLRYRVDNSVNVTLRELDKLGEVLDAVIVAGANSIYGIQFGLIDPEEAYTQAMQAAVENAQQRAEALALAASGELGEIQTLSTYYGSWGVPVMHLAADRARPEGGGGSDVPVSTGALEIRVEVNVIYGLE